MERYEKKDIILEEVEKTSSESRDIKRTMILDQQLTDIFMNQTDLVDKSKKIYLVRTCDGQDIAGFILLVPEIKEDESFLFTYFGIKKDYCAKGIATAALQQLQELEQDSFLVCKVDSSNKEALLFLEIYNAVLILGDENYRFYLVDREQNKRLVPGKMRRFEKYYETLTTKKANKTRF